MKRHEYIIDEIKKSETVEGYREGDHIYANYYLDPSSADQVNYVNAIIRHGKCVYIESIDGKDVSKHRCTCGIDLRKFITNNDDHHLFFH